MANIVANNMTQMKSLVNSDAVKGRLENLLGKQAGAFLASVLDLYNSDNYLQKCAPQAVIAECMKAAALALPISKALGFAYIIPYGTTPTFQLGYKGIIQLAQRTGQYKYINAGEIYEGVDVTYNRLTGMLEFKGEPTSDKVIGYFAYFQLLNGFEKSVYWPMEKVLAHAKKFSQAYKSGKKDSPWFTNFDAMAVKTVLKSIITKYGPMSVEFASAMEKDTDDRVEAEVAENANKQAITIETAFEDEQATREEPQTVQMQSEVEEGPGF